MTLKQAGLKDYGIKIRRRRRPVKKVIKPRPICDACFYFPVVTDGDGLPVPCNVCGRLLCRGCKRPGSHICVVNGGSNLDTITRNIRRLDWAGKKRPGRA